MPHRLCAILLDTEQRLVRAIRVGDQVHLQRLAVVHEEVLSQAHVAAMLALFRYTAEGDPVLERLVQEEGEMEGVQSG